jgi:general secretion pathway protein M
MHKNRRHLALLLSFLLLAAPLVAVGFYVYEKHQAAAASLQQLEPRYARLKGLAAQEADITALLEQTQKAGEQYVYPAAQDSTQAGNAAQQRIREILTAAGLQISSSQALPSKVEKSFERIPLSVRAEGDLLALESALAVFSGQLPLILIQELDVQPIGGLQQSLPPGVAPRLAVQFSFSVLKGQK